MTGTIEKAAVMTEKDLEAINALAVRKMEADEVYVFSVTLCDNEVDRDTERFSISTIRKLAGLYLGKTGIFDHNPKASNQTARIFATEVKSDKSRLTSAGEPYTWLKARAYMVRDDATKSTILSIDAGILKEVSIGCSVSKVICSECGADMKKSRVTIRRGKKAKRAA